MSGDWPASTGLEGSGLSQRRGEWTIWWRQAAGIFRAAQRARLRPQALAARLGWLFAAQAVIAAVAAIGLHQAGGPQGFDTIPAEAADLATWAAILLLLIHAIGRLGSVTPDVLRDVDQQVLEVYAASPLPASAYLAGRTAFQLLEQGLGLAALLPSFALAHAMRAFELKDLVAVALSLLAVSLAYTLFAIGRVLRAHGRRLPGAALPPSQRPGTGAVVAQALFGAAFVAVCFNFYHDGISWVAPLLLAFALTPAMPLLAAAFDGLSVDLFGRPVSIWLPASLWLGLLTPLAWSQTCLRWKAPVRASGAGLRLGFALAWLAPALVLSATLRIGIPGAVMPLLIVAGAGALILPAWAGGSELADVGSRPGARRWGILGARRLTAGPWSLLVQGSVLLLLALLAPATVGRSEMFGLALLAWAGTAPTILVTAAAARWLGGTRGGAVLVVILGVIVALALAGLPQLVSLLDSVPGLGALTRAAQGPAQLLASSSPILILPESASGLIGGQFGKTWLELPPAWSLGLPAWGAGLVVQALIGLPLAWFLNRSAERVGY